MALLTAEAHCASQGGDPSLYDVGLADRGESGLHFALGVERQCPEPRVVWLQLRH